MNYKGYSRKAWTASKLHLFPGCVGSKYLGETSLNDSKNYVEREKASCQNVSASVLPKSILDVQLIPFLCELLQNELVFSVVQNRNERNMCWAKSSISKSQ